jgi:molybdopterin-guanine dinucleotide biosynthesis protein A
MTVTHRTPIIVLAGGASRRMGTDKRLVDIDGSPMLQRVIDGLVDAEEILVVIDPARPLPQDSSADRRVRQIADLRPGEGPLAGLEAGLTAARAATVLVVAADMPWLEPAILRLLVARLAAAPGTDLACLIADRGPQPLPVACRRAPTLSRVTRLLESGERRLRALLDEHLTTMIEELDWRPADRSGRSLRDVDTPADLVRMR